MRIEIAGQPYDLPEFAPGSGGGFVFALHKGGSVLLNKAVARVTKNSDTEFFSLSNFLHDRGVSFPNTEFTSEAKRSLRDYFARPGIIFGGWRLYPANIDLPLELTTKTFLLVRDPRDILTSYYFYMKHGAPVSGPRASEIAAFRSGDAVEIDEFVLDMSDEFLKRYSSYDSLADRSDLMLRRYEDIIFDKASLLSDLCEHFGIPMKPKKLEKAAEALDQIPEAEDSAAHVRQVKPGDHLRKLQPETIERLNAAFKSVLTRYGYV